MQTLSHPALSFGLVFLQFAALGLLLVTGPWFANALLGFSWQIAGIMLGLWAVQTMHLGRFNIVPDPKPGSPLVQAGPYRLIRHPMYLAIFLTFTPLVIEFPSAIRWGIWGLLSVTLLIKLHYEERLLLTQFPEDYPLYQNRSYKLIPWIF